MLGDYKVTIEDKHIYTVFVNDFTTEGEYLNDHETDLITSVAYAMVAAGLYSDKDVIGYDVTIERV